MAYRFRQSLSAFLLFYGLIFALLAQNYGEEAATSKIIISNTRNAEESLRFTVADIDLPVIFEDQTISKALRKEIIDDLYLVYGHCTGCEFYPINGTMNYRFGDETIVCNKRIHLTGKGQHRPKEHRNRFGHIVTRNGTDSMIIPKDLSNAYQAAFKFKKDNFVEFQAIDDFVTFMNSPSIDEIPKFRDLFYLYGQAKKYESELEGMKAEEFIKSYGGFLYRKPSILDFEIGEDFLDSLGDKLVARNYVIDKRGYLTEGVPFIYDHGRWKLLIIIPGT